VELVNFAVAVLVIAAAWALVVEVLKIIEHRERSRR
jgi:hypothetical protein